MKRRVIQWAAVLGSLLLLPCSLVGRAQAGELILLAGLIQPVLFRGGNAAVTYISDGGWVVDYSHGFNLQLDAFDPALTKEERDQNLEIFVPYTTGFGLGHLITKNFDVRLEFKEHSYEVTNRDGDEVNYITRSIGVGAYYRYRFGNSSWLLEPSARYWPNYSSTLDGDKHTFPNGDEHKAHEFGLFANVSVGYAF